MTTPDQYEKLLAELYGAMHSSLPAKVFLRRSFIGVSGQKYVIDLGFEFNLFGVHYLTLVEAKHYTRRVEVGEVLEFAAKLDDVGGHKGVMVTTQGFQVGAQKVATARRIALVVHNPSAGGSVTTLLPKLGLTAASPVQGPSKLIAELASKIASAAGLEPRSDS